MIALIDADSIVYAAAFAAESTTYYHPETEQWFNNISEAKEQDIPKDQLDKVIDIEPEEDAMQLVDLMINSILDALDTDDSVVILSGKENYRYEVATLKPYKGTRTAAKPLYYNLLREYMIANWGAIVTDGIEADDECGIRQMEAKKGTTCIVSIDKDLDCVPGTHYNWRKKKLYEVSGAEALKFFYTQMLQGDSCDNIQGVPGIGPKKAEKALETCIYNGNIHNYEKDLYTKARELYVYYVERDMFVSDHEHAILPQLIRERVDAEMIENGRLLWMQQSRGDMWDLPEFE